MSHRLLPLACIFVPVIAGSQEPVPRIPAALSGVVRDSAGAPIPNVEVSIPELRAERRTDSAGAFRLEVQQPGTYEVWVRRLGYVSRNFDWRATAGRELQIAVTLRTLPPLLDTIVVSARERARMSGQSAIIGLVVDTTGLPVPDAEVQLLGASRRAITDDRGAFQFRRLAAGTYQVRVRQIGYAPGTVHSQLAENDTREMVIRLHQLPAFLDPVEVRARSGYGFAEQIDQEYEKRKLWRGSRTIEVGPMDLGRYGGMGLDHVAKAMGLEALQEQARMRSTSRITSIRPGNSVRMGPRATGSPGDVCVLENGYRARLVPLWTYSAKDVEEIEIWGANTDFTGSIGDRMSTVPQCRRWADQHPIYFVIWLKGSRGVKR